MIGIIYKIVYKPDGRPYIGQTKHTLEDRVHDHFYKGTAKTKFDKFIREHNINDFDISIIETIEAETEKKLKQLLDKAEIYWIEYYNTFDPTLEKGFNCTKGGGGHSGLKGALHFNYGRKYSPEVNTKKGRRGTESAWWGKHHTKETKKKLSDAHKKISKEKPPFFGKHHTKETKKKLSIIAKNRPHRTWVHTDMIESLIPTANVDYYISNGYKVGRLHKKI